MVYEKKMDIFQSFLEDIKSLSLKNHRILVGVSGGQDSSVLLHLCSMLPKKFHVFGLYVNHNLRNSVIAEEKFVINKSKIYGIPIYISRNDGDRFKMEIMKPIKINLHKKNEKDEITKQINELLEKLIVRDPSQWILTHNRWK